MVYTFMYLIIICELRQLVYSIAWFQYVGSSKVDCLGLPEEQFGKANVQISATSENNV